MIALQQMIIFFIIMGLGFIAGKAGFITEKNRGQISALVINITFPATVLNAAINAGGMGSGGEFFSGVGLIVALLACMVVCAEIIPRLLRYNSTDMGVMSLSFIVPNTVFVGIPLISSVFGPGALIFLVVSSILINVLFYTYGVLTVSKSNPEGSGKIDLRLLLNPGVICSVIAVLIYVFRIPVTIPVVTSALGSLSNLTGPLGMMILGATLVSVNFKEIFTDAKSLVYIVIKMIVFPVIALLILKRFTQDEVLLATLYVIAATPIGSLVTVLAGRYNPKAVSTASKVIAVSTLVSIVTMPIVSFLTGILN